MRIAFLTTEYPTEATFAGGVASNTARTARLLRDYGHDVEVFTLSDKRGTLEWDSVLVHRVPAARWFEASVRKVPLLRRYGGNAKVLSRSWPLAAALRKRDRHHPFELVQAVSNNGCGLMASLRRVAPLVTFVAAYRPAYRIAKGWKLSAKERQRERAEMVQMRRSDAVYAPSIQHAEYLRKLEGVPAEFIEYAYNFEHLSGRRWTPPEGYAPESYAVFFGRISVLKGCDRLVHALRTLLPRYPDMKFLFIGKCFGAPGRKKFDEFIRTKLAAFETQVEILPPQPADRLFRYVSGARFVTMPSRADNLPNTVLEAMELRRVIVATRDASYEQVLEHGATGILASQNDNDDLIRCLEQAWCLDSAERRRMGDAAHRVLDRFKSPEAGRRLEAFYEEVIASQSSRRRSS